MTELEAVVTLREADVTSAVEGALDYIKDLQSKCLDAGIPALAARPDASCATKSCGTRLRLMVRREDVPRLAALLNREWNDMLAREGTFSPEIAPGTAPIGTDDGEPPCPACGTAAPLVEGACSDCGLVLA